MLLAFRLSTRGRLQRGESARRTQIAFVYRRIVLEDLRHDGLARRLRARARRVDQGDAQSAGPLNLEHQLDRAMGRGRSAQWPKAISRRNARRVHTPQGVAV